jgi:hypothetical protein
MKYCEDCKFFGIEVEEKFFGLIHRNEEVCLHPSAAYGANQYKNNFRNVYTNKDKTLACQSYEKHDYFGRPLWRRS